MNLHAECEDNHKHMSYLLLCMHIYRQQDNRQWMYTSRTPLFFDDQWDHPKNLHLLYTEGARNIFSHANIKTTHNSSSDAAAFTFPHNFAKEQLTSQLKFIFKWPLMAVFHSLRGSSAQIMAAFLSLKAINFLLETERLPLMTI